MFQIETRVRAQVSFGLGLLVLPFALHAQSGANVKTQQISSQQVTTQEVPGQGGIPVQMAPAAPPAAQAGGANNQPTVFPGMVQQRRERGSGGGQKQNGMNQMAPFLQQLFGAGGMGGGGAAGGRGGGAQGPASAKLEDCGGGQLPSHIQKALLEAMNFREKCPVSAKSASQYMAINDYSMQGPNGPMMYIFTTDGKCAKKTSITYGRGKANWDSAPQACAGSGSNLTPPGFHITSQHAVRDTGYNDGNSLLMVGLERQGSAGRGILIHGAEAPGTASSLGCTGVGETCLDEVRKMLGYGSLVYNYFGDKENNPACADPAGRSSTRNPAACFPEATVAQGGPTRTTQSPNGRN